MSWNINWDITKVKDGLVLRTIGNDIPKKITYRGKVYALLWDTYDPISENTGRIEGHYIPD